jgi:hypothetical protein
VDLQNYSSSGVTVLDLGSIDPELMGFPTSFTDGRYGYLVPNAGANSHGKLTRVDLQNFTSTGVTVLDLTTVDPGLKGFWGSFSNDHYAYLVPYLYYPGNTPHGKLVRVDLNNFTNSGVAFQDLTTTDPDLKAFVGAFTDGKHGYLVPNGSGATPEGFGKIVRIQLVSGIGSP